jgi:hypothetical protein
MVRVNWTGGCPLWRALGGGRVGGQFDHRICNRAHMVQTSELPKPSTADCQSDVYVAGLALCNAQAGYPIGGAHHRDAAW